MEFVFAYLAGLLTLINPCVLPVLPIVLVSALNANRFGPIALAAGMSVSFVTFGVFVTAFGASIGLTQDTLAQIGATTQDSVKMEGYYFGATHDDWAPLAQARASHFAAYFR